MESGNGCHKGDLNLLVKNIVKILLTTSKYLNCPFCADEYLFEFTLKHHLLKNHERDLEKIVQSPDASIRFCESNLCPYCGALFYYISALPKHIMNSHSRECLMKWQAIEKENSLARKLATDPSIECVPCTPGYSDFYDELSADGSRSGRLQLAKPSPLLKSALCNANRAAAVAGSQHNLIAAATGSWSSFGFDSAGSLPRRTNSVRRELHFDGVTGNHGAPNGGTPELASLPTSESMSSMRKPKFQRKRFNLRSIKPKLNFRKYVLSKFSKKYHCKIVTSTPNNFLDDGSRDSTRFLHNQERWNRIHFE